MVKNYKNFTLEKRMSEKVKENVVEESKNDSEPSCCSNKNNEIYGKAFKNASKTTLKILLGLVFAFCYVVTIMFFVSPKTSAKVFHFFGYNKAEEFCYYKAYENSGSAADLYNLILFEQKIGDSEKKLYYINVLMNRSDYLDFCKKLDTASINACKDKKLIPYVGNVNSYLINQKISTMYKLQISCLTELKNQLKNGSILETSFATYVDLIRQNSEMSNSQKQAVYNEILTSEYESLLENRANSLKTKLEEYKTNNGNLADKILLEFSLMRLYEAEHVAYKAVGNEEKANEFKTLWTEIQEQAKKTLGFTK